jgi:MFS family permease
MTAFWGNISDKLNRQYLLITGAFLLMLLSYPIFYGLTALGEVFVWIFALSFSLIGSMINGCYVILIAESFPPNCRYSGVGFSYSFGVAIFSGIAPLAFTLLIQLTHILEAPGFYLLGCAALTLLAALSYQRQRAATMAEIIA